MNTEIPIGRLFYHRKTGAISKVIDVLKTYNSAGALVKTVYLCSHDFMGQEVRHEEIAITILRNAVKPS